VIPAPDGSFVLRGIDLAVVRDGKMVANAPGLGATAVAFAPNGSPRTH
jgi:hypothetical protein